MKRQGFTLIELLTVIAVIAILAALLLPVLVRAKQRAKATQCISNQRQLSFAWQQYCDDNNGCLPPADDGTPDGTNNWAWHLKAWGVQSGKVWQCPNYPWGPQPIQRVSMDMNYYLGTEEPDVNKALPVPLTYYHKLSALLPCLFLLMDSRSQSGLNYYGATPLGWNDPPNYWYEAPSANHGGKGAFVFVDGHSELHRWMDARTYTDAWTMRQPNNPDIGWIQDHATRPE